MLTLTHLRAVTLIRHFKFLLWRHKTKEFTNSQTKVALWTWVSLILAPSKRVWLNQKFLKGLVDFWNLMDSSLHRKSKSLGGICSCVRTHVYMRMDVCVCVCVWTASQWTWCLRKLQEIVKDREAWYTTVRGVAKNHTWLSNWTPLHPGSSLTYCFRERIRKIVGKKAQHSLKLP